MNQTYLALKNEKGSVLALVMVMLVILTLIGITATNMSNTEHWVSINEKRYKEALYDADAGVSWSVASISEFMLESAIPPVNPISYDPGDADPNNDIPPRSGDPNEIITARTDFNIFYLKDITGGAADKRVEILSRSAGDLGEISVIAGIQLPPPGGTGNPSGDGGTW